MGRGAYPVSQGWLWEPEEGDGQPGADSGDN